MKTLGCVLMLVATGWPGVAGEPFFKPDDVVALVGGTEMAMMRDHPGLERLVLQQPGLSGVRFRNLAFEGDTVFEQFRDLNFPSWEEQMTKVGATVVVVQFGKMESLRGEPGLAEFVAAYEKLLDRLAGDGRRLIVLSPLPFGKAMAREQAPRLPSSTDPAPRNAILAQYIDAIAALTGRRGGVFVNCRPPQKGLLVPLATSNGIAPASCYYYGLIPQAVARTLGLKVDDSGGGPQSPLVLLLKEKNQLWFHYWRPQNWAFLHGDRTEQASSRDHRDPTIRWFPAEMEEWRPLIAAKEREIQEMINTSRQP